MRWLRELNELIQEEFLKLCLINDRAQSMLFSPSPMESSSERSYLSYFSIPIIPPLFQELTRSCLTSFTFQFTLPMVTGMNPGTLTLNQALCLLQAMPLFSVTFRTKYNPLIMTFKVLHELIPFSSSGFIYLFL